MSQARISWSSADHAVVYHAVRMSPESAVLEATSEEGMGIVLPAAKCPNARGIGKLLSNSAPSIIMGLCRALPALIIAMRTRRPVRIPRVSMQGCANYCPELRAMPETQPRIKGKRMVFCYQNRQMSKSRITSPRPAKGPYCFNKSSQLMRTAARLYLRESSRKREDMSPSVRMLSVWSR